MQIGRLDRKIRIELPTPTQNSYGEETLEWTAYRSVWAGVEWKGGQEKEDLEKITATSKVVFYIRNLDISIDTTYRIVFNNKNYYIKVINEIDGRKRFLEILTEEKK